MSSLRFLGSTSADVRPDDGPRTLLISCTSFWKASSVLPELPVGSAVSISTADGMIAVDEEARKADDIGREGYFIMFRP